MKKFDINIVPGPHKYEMGIVYQDAGIQPHIANMATYFDSETQDTMGHLYAAAPLLLSALVKAVPLLEHICDIDVSAEIKEAIAALTVAGVTITDVPDTNVGDIKTAKS